MLLILICIAVLLATQTCAVDESLEKCLPAGMRPDTVIHVVSRVEAGQMVKTNVTLRDELVPLKATCRKGELVDATGKPIKLYRLRGCWGAQPPDLEEIIQKQKRELDELKKTSIVVEIPCNPDPMLPPAVIKPQADSSIEY